MRQPGFEVRTRHTCLEGSERLRQLPPLSSPLSLPLPTLLCSTTLLSSAISPLYLPTLLCLYHQASTSPQLPWSEVAKVVMTRTAKQCKDKWNAQGQEEKRAWTQEELQRLWDVMRDGGPRHADGKVNWGAVAEAVSRGARRANECRLKHKDMTRSERR